MKRTNIAMCIIGMLIVSGCASNVELDPNNRGPIVVNKMAPIYPKEAEQKGMEGEVWVKVWIDPNGRATKAMIEKTPDQSLCNAALDAAMGTKYKPAMMEGKPIGVWFVAPFAVVKKERK